MAESGKPASSGGWGQEPRTSSGTSLFSKLFANTTACLCLKSPGHMPEYCWQWPTCATQEEIGTGAGVMRTWRMSTEHSLGAMACCKQAALVMGEMAGKRQTHNQFSSCQTKNRWLKTQINSNNSLTIPDYQSSFIHLAPNDYVCQEQQILLSPFETKVHWGLEIIELTGGRNRTRMHWWGQGMVPD